MAKFKRGDKVKVLTGTPKGHCRTPFYLRGHEGVIEDMLSAFGDPERLAYHETGLPKRELYRVRFDHTRLWPGYRAAAGDTVVADVYEHWLEAGN